MTMGFQNHPTGRPFPSTAFPIWILTFSTQAVEIVSGGGKVVQFFAFQERNTVKADGRAAHRQTAGGRGCDAPKPIRH
jgi:hypothetical protein